MRKRLQIFFPKELNPTIVSSGSNNKPSIHLDYKINNHRIPIRLNLADHKFKYIITTKEYEINEKFGVIKNPISLILFTKNSIIIFMTKMEQKLDF